MLEVIDGGRLVKVNEATTHASGRKPLLVSVWAALGAALSGSVRQQQLRQPFAGDGR